MAIQRHTGARASPLLLPLTAFLAARAARPASDATACFATALSAATTSVEAVLAALAEQDQAPSQALLDRLAAATERRVAAHAALRLPAEGSIRAAIAEFVAAAARPREAYRRLQRAGN